MDPNLLLEYMCEYFDELSQIIVDEKGTIDKYIGDSIMHSGRQLLSIIQIIGHACCIEMREST